MNKPVTLFAAVKVVLPAIKQYFYNPICFKCGSFFVQQHLFCEVCFESEILPRLSLKQRTIQFNESEINHFYLFDWIPGESDLLSGMIYQIKSNRCIMAIEFYTKILTCYFKESLEGRILYNCVLPMPGSHNSSVHSDIIGEQVSQILGLAFSRVFYKETDKIPQKVLSSKHRKRVRVEKNTSRLNELFTKIESAKLRPIYVDDVLTTGSTLKAAINAIGACDNASILTLFYRPTILEVRK